MRESFWRRRGAFRFGASDSVIRHAFAPHVNTAVDCGRYVNPQGSRKQIEGAAIDRNTVVQFGKSTTDNGAVVQSSFRIRPIAPHERCSEDSRRAPGQALEKNPFSSPEPPPPGWSMASGNAAGVMTRAAWSGVRGIAPSRPRFRTC